MTEPEPNTLQTTSTSMELLDVLAELEKAGITTLAERVDKPKSTVHGHLATLRSEGYVFKRGGLYSLGPELLRLGNQVRTQREGYVLAREYTERMYEDTGFRSIFAVEMGGKAVFVHTASGNKMGWSHERLGNQLHLHSTAVGKAILAELPEPRIDRILDEQGTPGQTENTITDRDELLRDLDEIRERGYATNHEENIEDLYGIGVAATEQSGNVIGGFSITGPKHPFSDASEKRRLAEGITEIVEEYELELSLG